MAEEKSKGGTKNSEKSNKTMVNGLNEEPDFNDPEGYVDDISDEEMMADWLRKKPAEADGYDAVVVVDHIPEVGPKVFEKLKKVIHKIFADFGKILNEYYPIDESTKMTKGYIFLEYQNASDAAEAVKSINGYKLDRTHTFEVNLYSDFDIYDNLPEEWEAPEPQEYVDHGDLHSWIQDPYCYDQYSVIYDGGDRTSLMLNTHNEPTVLEDRQCWTETYVKWSPKGTYLATFHGKGIALWGGEKFARIKRFSHTGVQLIEFSPCERYMISFSPTPATGEDPLAIIWEVFTGLKKREFHCENASSWPIFKWNYNGNYFARLSPNCLSIYETPSFNLMDKKSLKIKGIKEFEWSPTDNYISYWTPEERDVPARVTLIKIPSREMVCSKNLFTVADCKMHWQKKGDFLCVKVDRYKSKKEEKSGQTKYYSLYYDFHIFRMREKSIPVEKIEIKEPILAFAWEPVGIKFAIIHGESTRIDVSIYGVKIKSKGGVEFLKKFEKVHANHLFWSPNGQFLVLAGLRDMQGTLEFLDTKEMVTINTAEHYMSTDVEWDPTGRYVVSSVSFWGHKMENAYWIWNFQGKLLQKQPMDRFCQFSWRPRPPTLLSVADIQKIKDGLSEYYPAFEDEDRKRENRVSKELRDKRAAQMKVYNAWRALCQKRIDDLKEERLAHRNGIDTDFLDSHVDNMIEETIEFLVDVVETVIEDKTAKKK